MPGSRAERAAGPGRSWAGQALALAAAFVTLSLLWNLPDALAGFVWPVVGAASLEITLAFALGMHRV